MAKDKWYIAGLVQAFLLPGERLNKSVKRREVWESYYLIRARNAGEAVKKAYAEGMLSDGDRSINEATGREYECRFVGLTDIMPVYDEIEDGCEVLWCKHQGISMKKALSMVRSRGFLDKRLKRLDVKANR